MFDTRAITKKPGDKLELACKVKHFVEANQIRHSFDDFIERDLLPALPPTRAITKNPADKRELACEIKSKRPKLVSPSSDQMTMVLEF
ncbi:hypothetical protein N7535_008086 [Penicillium sp. DV-2018c]|nr:hypothetical protein N7461_004122 [Penicillium sp. DV-2018c]KAJ5566448.1 hypothetical protein N7535_008086 [Penicillium sp. DV-2018c]